MDSRTTTEAAPARAGARPPVGELVFALGIAAVGGLALATAGDINVPVSTADVGPRFFPYVVGGALLVIGLLLVVQVLRGQTGEAETGEDVDDEAGTDWRTVALLLAVMVAHVFLIVPLGWAVSAALLFTGSALTLGARPVWRVALIAVAVALVIQFAFGGLLGVSLPPGPLLDGVEVLGG